MRLSCGLSSAIFEPCVDQLQDGLFILPPGAQGPNSASLAKGLVTEDTSISIVTEDTGKQIITEN